MVDPLHNVQAVSFVEAQRAALGGFFLFYEDLGCRFDQIANAGIRGVQALNLGKVARASLPCKLRQQTNFAIPVDERDYKI